MQKIQHNFGRNSFIEMLNYEKEHSREKFVFDVNQVLNIYLDINEKESMFDSVYNDPQLLEMIFSIISITREKDSIKDKLMNGDLFKYMCFVVEDDNRIIPAYRMNIREENLMSGDSFTIPEIDFTDDYYPDSIINGKPLYKSDNIKNWDFVYDSNLISINGDKITSLKKGCSIIKLINKKTGLVRRIKVNSGQIRQSNITEYFFSQIRNIIAHGRYSIVNSGLYDTVKEYGSYNMIPSDDDDRYMSGLQRDIILFEENQLNVSYDKMVKFSPLFWILLAKELYIGEEKQFINIINTFEDCNRILIRRRISNYTDEELREYNVLLALSKFYINFIYNLDSEEKESFDYTSIPVSSEYKGDLTNKEFIYNVRTAIMHGNYTYDNQTITFWNNDKHDATKKVFEVRMLLKDLLLYSHVKELLFYSNMIYDPKVLSVTREL